MSTPGWQNESVILARLAHLLFCQLCLKGLESREMQTHDMYVEADPYESTYNVANFSKAHNPLKPRSISQIRPLKSKKTQVSTIVKFFLKSLFYKAVNLKV